MTPPARFFRLHARDRISVLLVGGTPAGRFKVAHAFHRRSRLSRGPLVCLDAVRDDAILRAALHAWMGTSDGPTGDPVATAEYGTLLIDSIAGLSPPGQRLLLEFSSRHLNALVSEASRPWTGRLIVGDGIRLWDALRSGAFCLSLYDAVDKLRVQLPESSGRAPKRLSA